MHDTSHNNDTITKTELVTDKIPPDLIFNCDQMSIQLVPTGQWTMNCVGENMMTIANSDDKINAKSQLFLQL